MSLKTFPLPVPISPSDSPALIELLCVSLFIIIISKDISKVQAVDTNLQRNFWLFNTARCFLTSLTRRLTRPQRSSRRLILFGSMNSQKCPHHARYTSCLFHHHQKLLISGISFMSCCLSSLSVTPNEISPPSRRARRYRSNNRVPALWPTFRRKPEDFLVPDLFCSYVELIVVQHCAV